MTLTTTHRHHMTGLRLQTLLLATLVAAALTHTAAGALYKASLDPADFYNRAASTPLVMPLGALYYQTSTPATARVKIDGTGSISLPVGLNVTVVEFSGTAPWNDLKTIQTVSATTCKQIAAQAVYTARLRTTAGLDITAPVTQTVDGTRWWVLLLNCDHTTATFSHGVTTWAVTTHMYHTTGDILVAEFGADSNVYLFDIVYAIMWLLLVISSLLLVCRDMSGSSKAIIIPSMILICAMTIVQLFRVGQNSWFGSDGYGATAGCVALQYIFDILFMCTLFAVFSTGCGWGVVQRDHHPSAAGCLIYLFVLTLAMRLANTSLQLVNGSFDPMFLAPSMMVYWGRTYAPVAWVVLILVFIGLVAMLFGFCWTVSTITLAAALCLERRDQYYLEKMTRMRMAVFVFSMVVIPTMLLWLLVHVTNPFLTAAWHQPKVVYILDRIIMFIMFPPMLLVGRRSTPEPDVEGDPVINIENGSSGELRTKGMRGGVRHSSTAAEKMVPRRSRADDTDAVGSRERSLSRNESGRSTRSTRSVRRSESKREPGAPRRSAARDRDDDPDEDARSVRSTRSMRRSETGQSRRGLPDEVPPRTPSRAESHRAPGRTDSASSKRSRPRTSAPRRSTSARESRSSNPQSPLEMARKSLAHEQQTRAPAPPGAVNESLNLSTMDLDSSGSVRQITDADQVMGRPATGSGSGSNSRAPGGHVSIFSPSVEDLQLNIDQGRLEEADRLVGMNNRTPRTSAPRRWELQDEDDELHQLTANPFASRVANDIVFDTATGMYISKSRMLSGSIRGDRSTIQTHRSAPDPSLAARARSAPMAYEADPDEVMPGVPSFRDTGSRRSFAL